MSSVELVKGTNASNSGFESTFEHEDALDWTNVAHNRDLVDESERINVHSLFIKDVDDEYFITFACNMFTISFLVLGASLPIWITISTVEIWLLFGFAIFFYITMIIDAIRSKSMFLLKLHNTTQHAFSDVVDYVQRVKQCPIKLGCHVICYKYPNKTPTYTTNTNSNNSSATTRVSGSRMGAYSGVDDYNEQTQGRERNNTGNEEGGDTITSSPSLLGTPEIVWDHVYEYDSFSVTDHTHFGQEEVLVLKDKALRGHRDKHKMCLIFESRSHVELDQTLKDKVSAFTDKCKAMNAHRCDHVDVEMIVNLEGMEKVMMLNPAMEERQGNESSSLYQNFIETLMNPWILLLSTACCLGYMHREVLKTYSGTVDLCFQKRIMATGKTEEPVLVGGEQ